MEQSFGNCAGGRSNFAPHVNESSLNQGKRARPRAPARQTNHVQQDDHIASLCALRRRSRSCVVAIDGAVVVVVIVVIVVFRDLGRLVAVAVFVVVAIVVVVLVVVVVAIVVVVVV